jgi:amino acid adenylation domain-containing protein
MEISIPDDSEPLQDSERDRLLRVLMNGRSRNRSPARPTISANSRQPVSFGQRRLWFLDKAYGGTAYTIWLTVRISGAVSTGALGQAIDFLIERHDALRTVFEEVDGQPMQTALPPLPERGAWNAMSTAADVSEMEIDSVIRDFAAVPFDLSKGPLLRALLVPTGTGSVLAIGIHHISADGWSMAQVEHDLSVSYDAFSQGQQPDLPALPSGYVDYAVWLRDYMSGPVLEKHIEYWSEQLRHAPSQIELPFDRPRPHAPDFRGAEVRFDLGAELVQGLQDLAAQCDATPFMVLLAAFGIVLGSHAGQTDLVIGTPLAGRDRPEWEQVVGFFVNTLALRVDLSGRPSFRELMRRVRSMALGAYAHQAVPFELLVERLAPQREFAHNPLFQVMLALHPPPEEGLRLGDADVQPLLMSNSTAKFDLWLGIGEVPGGYEAVFEYDLTLFDHGTIEAFAGQLVQVLTAAARAPDVPVDELPLLTARQRAEVLALGSGPVTPVPWQPVHDQVSARARSAPEGIAVSFQGRTLSYAGLESAAAKLAGHLGELGAGPEQLVAIIMPRSLDLVVALLAVLKSGAAYVPIDPDYPADRVTYMLADSNAAIVLTVSECASLAGSGQERQVVLLDDDGWRKAPALTPGTAADPASLAYVIYTSGSTGKPKGAMIHHEALVNRLAWMSRAYQVGEDDRVLQKTPYSFDVSVWEFFLPLINGATLVVAPPGAHQDPGALAAIMATDKVTIAHFVPAMLDVFLGQPALPALPALRLLISSGEALPPQLADRAVRELSARCENLYGPTEAAVDVTAYSIGSGRHDARCAAAPIGKPIDNLRAHVLGPDMSVQPTGVPGELFLMGAGVGRGYLNRPGLTADRFLPDPFSDSGGYAYRTGDLARLLPDGNIEFLGRIDDQLKIHGFRVETGEIEAALIEHRGVRSAVVTAASGAAALVGYVVPDHQAASPDSGLTVVSQWREVFDEAFRGTAAAAGDEAAYAGWRSSYTDENYPADVMAEWVTGAVREILALGPRSVLEIGCGTGLLISELLPHVDTYRATDVSAEAVRVVASRYQENPAIGVSQRAADDLAGLGGFDVVVLNSVVQYFPDQAYLDRVLTAAAACGGDVFIGDVRDLRLLREFHLAVDEARRSRDASPGELRAVLTDAVDSERELAVDPRYFIEFAERHGLIADVRLKPGAADTEMNVFRYDVRLRRHRDGLLRRSAVRSLHWREVRGDLAAALAEGPVAVTAIPHPVRAPLAGRLRAIDAESGQQPPATEQPGLAPAELRRQAEGAGASCFCLPGDEAGSYDAVLAPPGCPGVIIDCAAAAGQLTNDPGAYLRGRALAAELREHLARCLPAYMIPAEIVVMRSLPLTPSGKVDRRALLPRPVVSDTQYERPQGPVESRLSELVCQLLNIPRIGRHDDFFRAGGESIVALHLVNRARGDGILLTPQVVFQHPTIAKMAAHCTAVAEREASAEAGQAAAVTGQLPDHRPWLGGGAGEVLDSYPLSPMQHEMLSAALEEPPEPGLHTAVLPLSISSPDFDESAFVSAWQYVMERHPILRSSFHWRGLPQPVQTVWHIEAPPVTRVDLAGLDASAQERVVSDAAHRERSHVFALSQAPLWHITLFRVGAGAYKAVCRFCYMLQDGWSFEIFLREFFLAYDHFRAGTAPELPPAPEFREYISWLMSRDDSADASYWASEMRRFAGRTPVLEGLGSPRRLHPRDDEAYAAEAVELPEDLIDRLGRLGRERALTLFMLIQGAWALSLAAITGAGTVTFGVISSGRPEHFATMSEMVGSFNNMLPAIVEVNHDVSVSAWLHRLQAAQAEMRQHQYCSLSQIREWGGLEWRTPLYDTYLVFENYPMDQEARHRLSAWEYGNGVTQTEHPIRVMIWPTGGLFIQISYYARLFPATAMRALLEICQKALTRLADTPDTSIGQIVADLRSGAPGVRLDRDD